MASAPTRRGDPRLEGELAAVDRLDTRQFLIAIKRLADSLSYGTDRSRFLGSGIEYVQSRPYQYGDPVRAIDWRVTARTGRVHVKDFESPKRIPVWLLVDSSASMTISSTERSKYALALQLAGGIALACLDRVSPVGVLTVGETAFRIEPSLGKDTILQWLLHMRRFRYDEATELGRRVSELTPRLGARSLVIALSDLHEPHGVQALKLLAQQHDCAALVLQDPAEISIRGAGILRAREAESGAGFVTTGRRQRVDHEAILAELRRGGVDHMTIRTDQPFLHRLRQFFQSRDVLGRAAR